MVSIIVCGAFLTVALGVGLGIGLRHEEAASTVASTTILITSAASNPASSPTSTSTSSPSSVPALPHSIINDTSLAAVTALNGDKHIFFQAANGSLRPTVFGQAASSWATEADFITTGSLPRNNTPIVAIDISSEGSDEIHLFYASTDDVITAIVYIVSQPSSFFGSLTPMNNSFPIAKGSRTLTISSMPPRNGTLAEALLLYKSPVNEVTILHGYFFPINTTGDKTLAIQWVWQNISDAVSASLDAPDPYLINPSNIRLSPPLSACSSPPQMSLMFFNPNALTNASAPPLYYIQFTKWVDLRKSSLNTFVLPCREI